MPDAYPGAPTSDFQSDIAELAEALQKNVRIARGRRQERMLPRVPVPEVDV